MSSLIEELQRREAAARREVDELLSTDKRSGTGQRQIAGMTLLNGLMAWAAGSKIPEFARLAAALAKYRGLIGSAPDDGVSNRRSQAASVRVRLLTWCAYGCRSVGALLATAALTCGGPMPGIARAVTRRHEAVTAVDPGIQPPGELAPLAGLRASS